MDSGSNQSAIDEAMFKDKKAQVYWPPEASEKNYSPGEPSDAYAYGIILVELATRNDPYGVSLTSVTQ